MTVADFSVQLFNSSANIMMVLLPVIFLGRITYSGMFGGYEDHIDNIKTLLIYLVFIKGFQYLLPYLVDLPHLINSYYNSKMNFDVNQILSSFAKSEQQSSLSFDVLSLLDAVTDLLEMLVQFLVDILFLVLSLLAPIIILLSVMLNLGVGVKLLFGLYFILATWNVAIAACDVFVKEIATKNMDMNIFIVALMAVFLKIVVGLTNVLLILKSQALGGVTRSLAMIKSSGYGSISKTGEGNYRTSAASTATYSNQKLERSNFQKTANGFQKGIAASAAKKTYANNSVGSNKKINAASLESTTKSPPPISSHFKDDALKRGISKKDATLDQSHAAEEQSVSTLNEGVSYNQSKELSYAGSRVDGGSEVARPPVRAVGAVGGPISISNHGEASSPPNNTDKRSSVSSSKSVQTGSQPSNKRSSTKTIQSAPAASVQSVAKRSQDRGKEPQTSDEELQTGHLEKKKGRK
jgi:hypothetical protein